MGVREPVTEAAVWIFQSCLFGIVCWCGLEWGKGDAPLVSDVGRQDVQSLAEG